MGTPLAPHTIPTAKLAGEVKTPQRQHEEKIKGNACIARIRVDFVLNVTGLSLTAHAEATARHVGDGIVRISRETKGRGGKAVTVINGLPGPPAELKAISKTLKHKCV